MRTRAVLGSLFASGAALVLGWQAGAAALDAQNTATTSTPTTTTTTTGTTTTPSTGTSATPTPTATQPASSVADGTYTGSTVSTRFGDVQVAVTISGGAITDVTALHLTDDDGRSVQISNRAAPVLREEVLAAQSASVANVSGATYTSQAYLSSLQSALDQAGF